VTFFWIALLFDHLFASKKFKKFSKDCAKALPESKQSFSVNQHLYLLKFVYGKNNELDPRVMPSTKKLKKADKKSKNSAKPE
jgi:hypothetical protein